MLSEVCRRVEHVDTDAAGVMHFSRYASLLETAALENLERLGIGVRQLGREDLDLVVAELRMKYSAFARFFDPLRIRLRVDHVGAALCRLVGTVHRAEDGSETLLASGSLVLCVVKRADSTATALPSRMRQTLRDCLNGDNRD